MAVYLVTWDLNKEGTLYNQARTNLIAAINTLTNNYLTSLDSVRFVSTTKNADELYDYIKSQGKLDTNDTLVVVKMVPPSATNYQGGLGKTLWDWINARI